METPAALGRKPVRILAGILLPGVLLLQVAVGNASEKKPSGTVEVRLTDHREAIGDFTSLKVKALSVLLHRKWAPKDQSWVSLLEPSRTVDLRRVTEGRSAVLLKGQAPAGDYDGVDLKIEILESQLRQGGRVSVNADLTPVVVRFQVQEGKKAVLTLDLIVLDLSDHSSMGYVVKVRGAKAKGTSQRFRGFGR